MQARLTQLKSFRDALNSRIFKYVFQYRGMSIGEKDVCPIDVQHNFTILDTTFIILLICGGLLFGIGIANIVISEANPSIRWVFSDLSPSYTTIIGLIIMLISTIGIVAARKIHKKTCDSGIDLRLI